MDIGTANNEALNLLRKLIATPRTSRNESEAADIIQQDLVAHGYEPQRIGDNILCIGHNYNPDRPAILLNSHIDTVKPVATWTRNPYSPDIENGRLYGIGSNDAGGSLASLLYSFYLKDAEVGNSNLIFLATCQEEVSGIGGMRMMAGLLPPIDVALIGEPTQMQPAIAEKGLMVLDFEIHGKSGHAARSGGINAIYRAMCLINQIKEFQFEKSSALLGPVRMSVTMINSGTQHNVIPDLCTMTVDIRSNEFYSNTEILETIQHMLPEWCNVKPRSLDLNSSSIDTQHPLIQRSISLGLTPFGSPTLSDQSILKCQSFKMGPGASDRSHTADEYILLDELSEAIPLYMSILNPF